MTATAGKASPLIIALAAGMAFIVGLGGGTATKPADKTPTASTAPASGAWVKPTNGPISSPYGLRCWAKNDCGPHRGTDLSVPTGTPVIAASSGVVADARCGSRYCDRPGHKGLGGYGNVVVITHPGNIETRYAHLVSFDVNPGQSVNTGDLIGRAGSTGNSTGPHLHFEVEVNGAHVNPEPFMRDRGARLDGAAP